MKKKVFSKSMAWLLSVVMAFGVLVFTPIENAEAYTSHSRDEAVAWARSKIGSKIDMDGYPTSNPYQCVDLIMAYYQYLGVSRVSGNGCDYSHNSLPSGWTRIQNTASFVPNPGDIVVWTDEGWKNGHVAIFLSGNTSNFTSIDQNWPQGSEVKEVYHSSYKYVWGVIRPDFTSNPDPAPNTFHGLSKVDRGTNFYGLIIRNENWAHLSDENGDVKVNNNGNIVWYFSKTSDGGYTIKNVATGKYLDVNGAGDSNNVNVQTWEYNGSAAQIWYIYGPWSGEYVLKPKCTGDRVLNVYKPTGEAFIYTFDPNDKDMRFALWDDIKTYTVSYNMNGGNGSIGNQTKVQYSPLTLSSTRPTRSGYTFVGWNTNKNATTAQYQPGGRYTDNNGATLYAIWKANTYTIAYNANGGSGSMNSSSIYYGQTLTLPECKFTKTGYNCIGYNVRRNSDNKWYTNEKGWITEQEINNTKSNKKVYSIKGSYGFDSSWTGGASSNDTFTFYPVWKINTYTVSYNMNGGSGSIGNQTKTYGQDLTLSSTKPTRPGYDFVGWNTSASATTAQYQPGGKYTANNSATLYAIWKAKQVTVTFYRNQNGSDNTTATQTFTYGVNNQSFSNKNWSKDGHSLLGWSENRNATDKQYSTNSGVDWNWIAQRSPKVTVYAVWKPNTYTVSYNMNGGSGSIGNQTKTYGQDLTLSSTKPTRTGYEFVGWNTDSNAATAQYSAGGKYTANIGATLYAVWREIGHIMTEKEAAGRTIPDGDYYIVSGINQDYFIDIPGNDFNTTSGKNVQMWIWSSLMPPKEGYDCFHFEYLNNGFYKITQINTKMCIDVANAAMYKGTNVQMCVDNGNNAQQWSVEKTSHGYRIRSKCNAYYLDVIDGKHENGTNVRCWSGNDSKAQSFSFIPRNLNEQPISDGVYTIKTNVNKTHFLDVSGVSGEFKVGSNVQIWTSTGNGTEEKYLIKYVGDGWYKIFEKTSGLILEFVDPSSNFLNNSKNVQLAKDNSGKNQLWKIRNNSDGTYFIINKANGYYLDLENSKLDDGSNVSQCTYNGSNAQRWILEMRTNVDFDAYKYANPNKTTLYAKISYGGTDKYITNLSDNASNDKSYKNIQLKTKNESLQQVWELEELSEGAYKISSVYDGRILDIYQTKTDNGTNIGACGTYYANGGQIWYLIKKDDKYLIQPRVSTNVCLGVANTEDGGNIQVCTSNNYFNIELIKPVGTSTMKVVQEGTSTSPTKFTWTAATDATWYNLYIYDGEVWKSNCTYGQKNIKGLEWSVQLKPGTYQAHLSPINVHNWTNSNFVSFTVKENKYTMSFNSNGGTGTIANMNLIYGEKFSIPENQFSRTGYQFRYFNAYRKSDGKWYTSDGHGWQTESEINRLGYSKRKYPVGENHTMDNNWTTGATDDLSFEFYAIWEAKQVDVTFHRNYTPDDTITDLQTFTYDVEGQTFSEKNWTRKGYDFLGWAFEPDAHTARYDEFAIVINSWINDRAPSVDLYAVWKEIPVVNTSEISSIAIKLGTTFTVTSSAIGGTGDYEYAVFYKKIDSTKWTTAQNFSDNSTVKIKPAKAVKYDVLVKVKDSSGKIAEKTFTVDVYETLKNTSTVVSENIGFGDTVTVKAKSTGGLGGCTYAVYYKKASAEKWSTLQKYSDNTTVTFKPASATTYDVMVKVKDSRDVIVKKNFTVSVTKPENTSTIAATEIKIGNTINISCSATGSSGFYQYAVLYKKASSEKWTTSQNYSPNNSIAIKPTSRTTYNICVKVKDNFGNISKKYFEVTVK